MEHTWARGGDVTVARIKGGRAAVDVLGVTGGLAAGVLTACALSPTALIKTERTNSHSYTSYPT